MPRSFVQQAKHNTETAAFLSRASPRKFLDWEITTIYYSILMACKQKIQQDDPTYYPRTHEDVLNYLDLHHPAVSEEVRKLHNWCWQVRYNPDEAEKDGINEAKVRKAQAYRELVKMKLALTF
ncbi:MAG: hypothetical protein WCX64_03925 [Candidatus Micrarchaeia archaeon]